MPVRTSRAPTRVLFALLMRGGGARPAWRHADQVVIDAVNRGQLATVEARLQAGADPNACGSDLLNPLQLAGESSNVAIPRLLLDHGAKASGMLVGGERR